MISIIVPCYNSAKYIRRCVESVLKQTYREFELLLIDDCSTDNSFSILKEYEKKDSRVRVYQNDTNGGTAAKARNNGITKATGDYVMYIDSDDYLPVDALEILYNNIIKYNADISVGGYYKDIDGKITSKKFHFIKRKYSKKSALKHFLNYKTISGYPWAKLYKKSVIEKIKFREDVRLGEDATYVFNSRCNSNVICFNKKPTYCYCIRSDSASAHGGNLNNDELTTLKQLDVIRKCNDRKILNYSRIYEFEMNYIILKKYLRSTEAVKKEFIDFYRKCIDDLKHNVWYTLLASNNVRIKLHCVLFCIGRVFGNL